MKWLLLFCFVVECVGAGVMPPKVVHKQPRKEVVTKGAFTPFKAKAFVQPAALWLVWGSQDYVWLEWDSNKGTNVLGYLVYSGPVSGSYNRIHTNGAGQYGMKVQVPIDMSAPGKVTYFAVSAFDKELEGWLSKEVSYTNGVSRMFVARLQRTAPMNSPVGVFEIQSTTSLPSPVWQPFAVATNAFLPIVPTDKRFFRVGKKP